MFAMSVETSVSLVFCPTFARTVDGQQFSSKVFPYSRSIAESFMCMESVKYVNALAQTTNIYIIQYMDASV